MRVLISASNPGPVADYIRARDLGRELVRRGHKVTVLHARADLGFTAQESVVNGVRVIAVPRLPGSRFMRSTISPMDIFARCYHVLRDRYDVYHAISPLENTVWPWLLAKVLYRSAAFVFDQLDLYTDGGYAGVRPPSLGMARLTYDSLVATERWAVRNADVVTVLSTYLRKRAVSLGAPCERTHIVPVGVPVESIRPILRREAIDKLGLDGGFGLLGYAARAQDDITELFTALRTLIDRGYRVRLLVTGRANPHAAKVAAEMELSPHVVWAGWVPDDLFGYYLCACSVLLLPFPDTVRNRARWPIKLAYYLAAGRPVVVGTAGDIGSFIRRHGVGWTYSDPLEMAQRIADLLNHPNVAEEMGQRARKVAEKELSTSVVAERFELLYAEALRDRELRRQEQR